jgi:DNA-binding CsgD family transcriptional regulator
MLRSVPVVDAAYEWVPDDSVWLDRVVHAAQGFQVGGGIIAYIVDLRGVPRVVALSRTASASQEVGSALVALTESFAPRTARAAYAPTQYPGNARFRLARVARTMRTKLGALEGKAGHALPSTWALVSGDPRTRVAVFSFPAPSRIGPEEPFPSRVRGRQLGLIGAHLGAALRLRTTVGALRPDDATTEAVLTPRGQVLHATGAAVGARQSIAEAVLSIERARLRKVSDAQALELWNALVGGRWSIVNIVERDGKRLVLARRNEVNGERELLALDDLERDVLWLASMGHSYKYIAYELGIHVSMVVRRMRSGLKKLRLRSRTELLKAFASGR